MRATELPTVPNPRSATRSGFLFIRRFSKASIGGRRPRAPDRRMFTIGIIQDHAGADVPGNLARAERLVRDAARRGAQIVCLKELFKTPYFCKSQQSDRFDLAEPIPGPTTEAMQRLARELAVVLVVPIFERQAAGI